MGNGSASNGHVRQSESDEMEIVDLTVAKKPSVVTEKPRIPTSHQREPLVSVEEVQQECTSSSAYESLCSSTSTHSRPHIIYRKPSHLIALTSNVWYFLCYQIIFEFTCDQLKYWSMYVILGRFLAIKSPELRQMSFSLWCNRNKKDLIFIIHKIIMTQGWVGFLWQLSQSVQCNT